MTLQVLTARGLIRRLECREIGVERGLGIHHQLARLRQVHDQVGSRGGGTGACLHLLGEVALLDHAGQFHHPTQRQFAPAPAHFRPPQRRHQVAGLALQSHLAPRQQFDLAAQRHFGIAALDFQLS